MYFFRHSVTRYCISLLTGIVFLNLSFLLTEIHLAGLRQKNPDVYKTIVQLFTITLLEEETDSGPEGPVHDKDDINLFAKDQSNFCICFYLISSKLSYFTSYLKLPDLASPIHLPPPEPIA